MRDITRRELTKRALIAGFGAMVPQQLSAAVDYGTEIKTGDLKANSYYGPGDPLFDLQTKMYTASDKELLVIAEHGTFREAQMDQLWHR